VQPDDAFTSTRAATISLAITPYITVCWEAAMRAEAQKVVTSIEEALVLLRRSL
jgi:hypothetical protein